MKRNKHNKTKAANSTRPHDKVSNVTDCNVTP